MKTGTKLLSFLLSILMIVMLLPTTASAAADNGEWFGYCGAESECQDSIGTGGGDSITWAMKIPSANIPQYKRLSKISYYTNSGTAHDGAYHIRIYSTDTTATDPGTASPDYEQLFILEDPVDVGWHEIELTTPYVIDHTKDLWIGIENTDVRYPASFSTEVNGNADSCMMYFQGSWYSIDQLGDFQLQPWMIRGYFEGRLIVTDSDGETVEPGSETYEIKEDGIHVYADDIYFSGETDKNFVIENEWTTLNLTDIVIDSSLDLDGYTDGVLLHMSNAVINGDISAHNSSDNSYLAVDLEGDNVINGKVTADGFTVFGSECSTLSVKSAETKEMVYLEDIRIENMTENYEFGTTKTMTPKDTSKPILLTIKKQANFPSEDDFIINDGNPFKYGEKIDIEPPVACNEDYEPLDPQPELTVTYYKYEYTDDWYMLTLVDGIPTEEGDYCVRYDITNEYPDFCGYAEYDFSITHGTKKIDGKDATLTESGYKPYYECLGCGEFFEDEECETPIEDLAAWKAKGGNGYIPKLDPVKPAEYKIIKGADQTVAVNAESATFSSNADFNKFARVEVDGQAVAKKYYKAQPGSTVITFSKEYISTLKVGEHTLKIVSSDGSAETKFTIVETPPETGDQSAFMLWIAILLISGGAFASMMAYRRRVE